MRCVTAAQQTVGLEMSNCWSSGQESTAEDWKGADYQSVKMALWKLACPNWINALIKLAVAIGEMVLKYAGHKQKQMVWKWPVDNKWLHALSWNKLAPVETKQRLMAAGSVCLQQLAPSVKKNTSKSSSIW